MHEYRVKLIGVTGKIFTKTLVTPNKLFPGDKFKWQSTNYLIEYVYDGIVKVCLI